MAYRIALQVAIFLLPFVLYAVYRLLLTDAEADGRKTWPINTLFGTGAALTVGLWVALAVREPKDRDLCYEPARVENGVLVPGRQVPCETSRAIINVGAPTTEEPGAPARGFGVRPREDVARADEVPRTNDTLPPLPIERPIEGDLDGAGDTGPAGAGAPNSDDTR